MLTPTAYSNRLAKASLVIRTMLQLPDVIGVEEIEKLAVLQAIAAQVNADVVAGGGTDPSTWPTWRRAMTSAGSTWASLSRPPG